MITSTKTTGNRGELAVAKKLHHDGFTILHQNYQIRQGEIDIIAQKDDLIIFVEVKTRKHQYFPLSQVITPSKQRKIINTAKWFIAQNKIVSALLRFDVALVTESKTPIINYIANAFQGALF